MWFTISLAMVFIVPITMLLAAMIYDYRKNSYKWQHKYEKGIIRNFFAYISDEWSGTSNVFLWYMYLILVKLLIAALIVFAIYIASRIAHTFIWR